MIIQSQIFSINFLTNEHTKYNNLKKTFSFEKQEKYQLTGELQQLDKQYLLLNASSLMVLQQLISVLQS